MIAQVLVFGVMLSCALLPFMGLTVLVRRGQGGAALTIVALTGAGMALFLFASGRPFGVDPVLAMAIALIGFVPAFLGVTAGGFLGWLLRQQDRRNQDREAGE